jgi:hypothetical protein
LLSDFHNSFVSTREANDVTGEFAKYWTPIKQSLGVSQSAASQANQEQNTSTES